MTSSGPAPTRLVDLSHTLREGLVTYPGIPAPRLRPHVRRGEGDYAPGTSFSLDVITLAGNSGTYLDAPWHRYEGAADLAALDLETLVDLPCEVVRWEGPQRGVPPEALTGRRLQGAAVLLHTGWDRHFGTAAYGEPAPYLTPEGVDLLVEGGAALVGIDSLNIDDTGPQSGGRRPAHSRLLERGIHVVEHLTNLAELPASGSRFTAVPPKIEGTGTFPVRAFARLPA